MVQDAEPKKAGFKWVKSEKGTVDIYTNMIQPTWTLFDVRLVLGLLGSTKGNPTAGFAIEEQGGVLMSWPQAKALRDILTNIVAAYEKANGEIKEIKLAQPEGALAVQPK
jgi:hypothetical protein